MFQGLKDLVPGIEGVIQTLVALQILLFPPVFNVTPASEFVLFLDVVDVQHAAAPTIPQDGPDFAEKFQEIFPGWKVLNNGIHEYDVKFSP